METWLAAAGFGGAEALSFGRWSAAASPVHFRRNSIRIDTMSRRALAPFIGFALLGCYACAPLAPHAAAATIGLNFSGVNMTQGTTLNGGVGYSPPDCDGAVGPSDIVQLMNGAFAVYDKTPAHNQLELISAHDFWKDIAGVDPGTDLSGLGVFNQRILYDPSTDRWIAAGLSGESTNNRVMIARSDTSDPLGTWQAVAFSGNVGGPGQFVDFTRMGVDANGVYISTNNFTSNPGYSTDESLFSLPKADLLAPTPTLANLTRFDGQDVGVIGASLQPITNFGPAPSAAPLLATSLAGTDSLLYRTDLNGTAGPGATLSATTLIPVNQYTTPQPAGQPNGSQIINTIDNRITGNVYQVGDTIYAVHATNIDAPGGGLLDALIWYKIDANTNAVIQEGTLSSPTFDWYQPSIAANANGDVVISFDQSGTAFGGAIRVMALVGTTVGSVTTFDAPIQLQASTTGAYSYNDGRWGDYSTTVVDPTNANHFWTFQEYALAGNLWATQISEIIVPEPGSLGLAALAAVSLAGIAWRRRSRAARSPA